MAVRALLEWHERAQVEAEIGSVPMVLIQNKIDLIDKAVVTPEEATALADKANARMAADLF